MNMLEHVRRDAERSPAARIIAAIRKDDLQHGQNSSDRAFRAAQKREALARHAQAESNRMDRIVRIAEDYINSTRHAHAEALAQARASRTPHAPLPRSLQYATHAALITPPATAVAWFGTPKISTPFGTIPATGSLPGTQTALSLLCRYGSADGPLCQAVRKYDHPAMSDEFRRQAHAYVAHAGASSAPPARVPAAAPASAHSQPVQSSAAVPGPAARQ
jgi:hypothetical protein